MIRFSDMVGCPSDFSHRFSMSFLPCGKNVQSKDFISEPQWDGNSEDDLMSEVYRMLAFEGMFYKPFLKLNHVLL